MKPVAVFGLLLMLAGCAVHYEGDDALSRTFGSNFFGVGGLLNLTDPTAGDAFLAGGHINTASEVTGDLVAAGGEVSVGGGIGDDLYAAGGKVQVDAIVAGNARLAGGEVTVGPATVIDGSVTMSGGRVSFEGSTRGNLQASGGSVRIDGTVEADAEVNAEDVEIGPQTRIAGKLIVRGPRAPTIPEGAQIAGGVVFNEAAVSQHFSDHVHAVAQGVGSFLWILGVFVAGTLFTLAFPAYSARAADWIGRAPLRSLGLGFVLLVCLPVLAMLLVITIVGIPLALLIGMAYVLLLFLGWVTAALFVARKGLALLRGARPVTTGWLLLALLLAVLALWGVGQVPVLGGWVTFIALLLGIGALVWQGWPRRNPTATIAA